MKKIYVLFMSIVVSLGIMGCSNSNDDEQMNKEDKIVVYTTVFPIYDFTRNIGKDKIDIKYVIPPGVEPHDYEITPKTMKDIQEADLLIKNGLGIDGFIDKLEIESDLQIAIASENIKPIEYDITSDCGSDSEHEHEHDHDHGEYDPHMWLDVELAIKQCENIKEALIKVDEENKDYYEQNYNEYITRLHELSDKYDDELNDIKKDKIIVSHSAYGYLCKKYDIEQISITGITPNQEPSLSKISEISDYAKDNNIKYVLFDGLVNPKVSETIANEAGIGTKVLYSIDGITKDSFDSGENYISLMNENLETLKLILK